MEALVHHRKPATSSTQAVSTKQHAVSQAFFQSHGEKEEEWAEKERLVGQTVRGKGSKGPGCPGEGDPMLQKCPHQASGYRPGPAEVHSQCAQVSGMDKGSETGLPWQSSWAG
ncbi:hypothetical protein KUCAC02_028210 [Chaenocephalus aceratus]|uniref:Uncharacterized protein n=1 Tax=Chaenocephalus aceratus TaxID=36190 RepID=A0ACB9X330_CHAAC|nr:hypothetical protein KUCAC02_028210 [Chaenocephalus aceratus]